MALVHPAVPFNFKRRENMMPSEISQAEDEKYYMILLTYGI